VPTSFFWTKGRKVSILNKIQLNDFFFSLAMIQMAVLDKIETVACAIEFLVHLMDKDVRSPDDALDAVCALAELFERNTIVGYTTIDGRGRVATFQTAVYPRLPTWPFSKVHGVPIKRPYVGTCAQAICEGRPITCGNIATETRFDPSWRAACREFGLRSVQSAPVFGFDGRPLGTFVTASRRSRHSFDRDMTGFGVYALRTILQKQVTTTACLRVI
jgi:GAF domain